MGRLVIVCVCLVMLVGCRYYSMTGSTIPAGISTIAIPLPVDETTNPITDLDAQLASALVDRFVNQTRLRLDTRFAQADSRLDLRVVSYTDAPASIGGNEVAQTNRITIGVVAQWQSRADEVSLLDRRFSGFAEYDPVDGPTAAIVRITEQLADEIFTAATANW